MTHPLNTPCTYCLALAGEPCRVHHNGWAPWQGGPIRPTPHAARRTLAGSGWTVRRHDGDPVAEPLEVKVASRSVSVRCPICATIHHHGWAPYMDHEYSHRAGHCMRSSDGYVIAPTAGLTRSAAS